MKRLRHTNFCEHEFKQYEWIGKPYSDSIRSYGRNSNISLTSATHMLAPDLTTSAYRCKVCSHEVWIGQFRNRLEYIADAEKFDQTYFFNEIRKLID